MIETSAGPDGIVIRNYYTPDFPIELKANINKIPAMQELSAFFDAWLLDTKPPDFPEP